MVKARQKNFRAFIFSEGEVDESIAYIDKNFVLLKDYLLVFIYKMDKKLVEFLEQKGASFLESIPKEPIKGELYLQKESQKDSQEQKAEAQNKEQEQLEPKEQIKTKILHRTIRSGEEIISAGDLSIFGRINSGAHIQAEGNVQIFGLINGNVFCNGDYMILGKVNEGNILFQGEIVDKSLIKYNYNKIYKENDCIVIKELV